MILAILALLGFRELHGYDGPLQYLSQGNPDSMTAVQVQAMRLYIYVEEAGEGSGMGLCLIGGHLPNIRPQKSKMSN